MSDKEPEVQVVEGVPVAIVVTVGPGVLVEGLPQGRSVTAFMGTGCVHSISLQALARIQALLTEAMQNAQKEIDRMREEAVNGSDPGKFVA